MPGPNASSDRFNQRFSVTPLKLWPGKLRFQHVVEALDIVDDPEIVIGSAYKDWRHADSERRSVAKKGLYVFAGYAGGESGQVVTLWNPPVWTAAELESKTEEELAKGKLVKERWDTKDHVWPTILHSLQFAVNTNMETAVERPAVRDGGTFSCRVRLRTYVSNTPWSKAVLKSGEPRPDGISGIYLYRQKFEFPECLHPEIVAQSLPETGSVVVNATPSRKDELTDTIELPATNMTSWEDHVFSVDVAEEDNLHYRVEAFVEAPHLKPLRFL